MTEVGDGGRAARRARDGGGDWTIRRAFEWTRGYLDDHGDEHARLSTEWLLSAATGLSRVELYLDFDRPLDMSERSALREGVRRRAVGEPLQYVTGEVAFRHIVLKVEPGVLIPRPETEMLVEHVLELLPPSVSQRIPLQVLEPCTGSGCIACSIAHERPDVSVVATDLSETAVSLAERNVSALGLSERIEVVGCDLADGVGRERSATFSALVSNPPYIPTAVLPGLPGEVSRFEPRLALDGGDDGLRLLSRLIDAGTTFVAPGGFMALELFEDSLELAASRCEGAGLSDVEIRPDLTGRPRFLIARFPERY